MIKSVEYADGIHYFPCRRCEVAHAIHEDDLVCVPPDRVGSVDEAIIRDRIVSELRATWGSTDAHEIADRHGRHVNVVYRIGRSLGLWSGKD